MLEKIVITLYKYMTAESAIKVLKSKSLWFQNPSEFNDIFEGRFNTEKMIRPREGDVPISFAELGPTIKKCSSKLSVTCFSAVKDNYLMWAHYADNYKGVCLEFDFIETDFFDNSELGFVRRGQSGKVNYSTEFPKITFHEKFLDWTYIQTQIKDALFTKSVDWMYEEEFRVLLNESKGLKKFSATSLRNVTLGPRCGDEQFENIKKEVQEYNKINSTNIGFDHGVISGTDYKLSFLDVKSELSESKLTFRVTGTEKILETPELTMDPYDKELETEIKKISNTVRN